MAGDKSKLKALSDIALLDISLEFDEILKNILKITCEALNAPSGTMMLINEDSGEPRMVASHGLPQDYPERVHEIAGFEAVKRSSGASGRVLKTGEYYLVPNILEEPGDKPRYDLSREPGFSSRIFMPIKKGLKVTGLLNVNLEDPRKFTEEEIDFLTIAASQASFAVHKARNYSRLEDKRFEASAKESETIYRELFENAEDPMYTLDIEGNFLTINNSGLRILGCTKEEVIGTHISKWLTPESLLKAQEALKRQVSGESIQHPVILEVICKNGEHRWGEIRTRHIEDGGMIIGVHGIARDVTEKKRMEQKLKEYHEKLMESEARYRDLFNNATDPMYTLDTEGCFREINNAGLRVLGGTLEETIGSNISKWLTPESLRIAQERLGRQFRHLPVPKTIVYELICKNGEHRWAEISTRAIKSGDKVIGIQGNARDVTEKRRLELQLKEYHEKLQKSYEDLIEADRMKTEFVSNISHELLTPMTSIKGFTELLYDEGRMNDEQKKSLEIILRNSDRLIKLIKDLLDVAALEKKKFGLNFEPVSLNDIISKSVQYVQPMAIGKQINMIQNVAPLSKIWGDEERLIQVMTNLITNAIKFTPEKGTITVCADETLEDIRISVADTGIGIPADKLCCIFDRFYQLDGSNSRKHGGIGLGLSICKSIVESHYGSIWAESEGKGSTFRIVLPRLGKEV
ncbi:MAG: PAS domain S-box protein [Candidatus Methanoperedens sp.]|nr:PAS domain S-box protein [Candidatus Methanoperedens sp.]